MTMINQSVSLYDEIVISKNNGGINIIDSTTTIKNTDNIMGENLSTIPYNKLEVRCVYIPPQTSGLEVFTT